jgi:hypothetical protein
VAGCAFGLPALPADLVMLSVHSAIVMEIDMRVWAKRRFELGAYGAVRDRFADLQTKLGAPPEMMMVEAKELAHSDIFISLPDKKFLPLFNGFQEIVEAEVPKKVIGLVFEHTGFEKQFGVGSATRASS